MGSFKALSNAPKCPAAVQSNKVGRGGTCCMHPAVLLPAVLACLEWGASDHRAVMVMPGSPPDTRCPGQSLCAQPACLQDAAAPSAPSRAELEAAAAGAAAVAAGAAPAALRAALLTAEEEVVQAVLEAGSEESDTDLEAAAADELESDCEEDVRPGGGAADVLLGGPCADDSGCLVARFRALQRPQPPALIIHPTHPNTGGGPGHAAG